MPNPREVATVVVRGGRFDDWETVFVQHRWNQNYPIFRFTAAERDPVPDLWQTLQFKPDDPCEIYLGGLRAITGVILVRQTAYDANNHGVLLQGVGVQWYVGHSSVMDETGSFDDMTFEQVARKVMAPTGVGIEVVGTLDATPFKRLQNNPGETIWDFLERIARPLGIVLGSNGEGNLLLIGPHVGSVIGSLIEGVNILKCQAVISVTEKQSEYWVSGQTAASDEQHGRQASEQLCMARGTAKRYSPLLTPAEQPVWNLAEICKRAENESIWHEGTEVQATITVQGWFNPAGGLWEAGADVHVKSPMAMLNMVMKIQTATFTQDRNQGSLTTLDLVAPWLLRDMSDVNVGNAGAPQPPPDAQSGAPLPAPGTPFETPPAQLEE